MRKAVIYGFALVAVSILCFLNVTPVERRTLNPDDTIVPTASATKPMQVQVTNFPGTQNVGGTVNMGNLPAVQTVAGTVSVGNLPAVQTVGGSVAVSNLPMDEQGNVKVAGVLTILQTAPGPHFVGLTTTTLPMAGQGNKVIRLSRICAAEFPGTRVCEDIDLVRSIPPPPAFDSVAWVMRIITLPSSQPDPYPQIACEDFEGNESCGPSGTAHPVACCGF